MCLPHCLCHGAPDIVDPTALLDYRPYSRLSLIVLPTSTVSPSFNSPPIRSSYHHTSCAPRPPVSLCSDSYHCPSTIKVRLLRRSVHDLDDFVFALESWFFLTLSLCAERARRLLTSRSGSSL